MDFRCDDQNAKRASSPIVFYFEPAKKGRRGRPSPQCGDRPPNRGGAIAVDALFEAKTDENERRLLSIVQRHDQNGTFCPLQNPVDDATRKEMIKKTMVVRAENNQVYTIILRLSQNQFDRGALEFHLG